MTTQARAHEIAKRIGEEQNEGHIKAILEWHGAATVQQALERAKTSEQPGPEFFRSIQQSKKTRKALGEWPKEKYRDHKDK